MLKEFNITVKGTYQSQVRKMARYTKPIPFLKYKLGRLDNLLPEDLTEEQYDYYKEIGGLDDVQEMLRLQINIDALEKALPRKRTHHQMISVDTDDDSSTTLSTLTDNLDNRNHNRSRRNSHNNAERSNEVNLTDEELSRLEDDPEALNFQTFSEIANISEIPKMENPSAMDTALNQLSGGWTQYEKEQLEKKKKETRELFQEKINTVQGHTASMYRNQPELIGTMAGSNLDDQLNIAFDFWISDNLQNIKQKVYTLHDFTEQVSAARERKEEWTAFLQRWKLTRITSGNDFQASWDIVVTTDHLEIDENLLTQEEAAAL